MSAATWLRDSCRSSGNRESASSKRPIRPRMYTRLVTAKRLVIGSVARLGGLGQALDRLLAAPGGLQGPAEVHQGVRAVDLLVIEGGAGQFEIALGLVAIVEDLGDVAVMDQAGARQVRGPEDAGRGHPRRRPARAADAARSRSVRRKTRIAVWTDRGIPRSVQVLDRDEIGLDVRLGIGELGPQGVGIRLEPLVGIDGQHPFTGGVRQRGVPGDREGVLPFALDDRCARLAGDLHRPVSSSPCRRPRSRRRRHGPTPGRRRASAPRP